MKQRQPSMLISKGVPANSQNNICPEGGSTEKKYFLVIKILVTHLLKFFDTLQNIMNNNNECFCFVCG